MNIPFSRLSKIRKNHIFNATNIFNRLPERMKN